MNMLTFSAEATLYGSRGNYMTYSPSESRFTYENAVVPSKVPDHICQILARCCGRHPDGQCCKAYDRNCT